MARYVIRELTGYNITRSSMAHESHHKARPTTDVAIFDSWECYHTVAFYPARKGAGHDIRDRRRKAWRECSRLNREHESWERDGSVA